MKMQRVSLSVFTLAASMRLMQTFSRTGTETTQEMNEATIAMIQ
jgi:hypothetical protein